MSPTARWATWGAGLLDATDERVDRAVMLLEQRVQHVLGAHIVVVVVTALLLRGAEHAPSGGAET